MMRNNYLLALLSAFLLWLAWPPIPLTSPLLLFAFIPLLIAVERVIRSTAEKKGRQVFILAFLTGVVWNTASIYWVYNAMNAVLSPLPSLLIALIPFCLAPLLMAFAFRGYYALRKKQHILISFFGLIGFWISYEYLHQSWDLAFPWITLGNGFASVHQIVQWYEYTGVYGGTVWIWLCNMVGFLLVWQYMAKIRAYRPSVLLGSLCALLIIPTAWSLWRYSRYEEHINPSEIVVVQPNIDPYGKFGSISSQQQLDILLDLSKRVAKPNTEFFIWPETAISSANGINEEEFRNHPHYQRIFTFLNDYRNGNVLSGIESFRVYDQPETSTARQYGERTFVDAFNAAVLIDQSSKLDFYHKSKLVPGVEQLPFSDLLAFLKPFFAHFGGTTGGYGKQDEPSVFYSQSGIGAAPVICYESIWGSYVAQYVDQGAQFIAVITNDGWWSDTSGKDQHLQYAKLRAIENRRWVVRSANTGISGFINQRGDIIQQSGWWVPDALTQEINLNEELTLYTQAKDWIVYIFLAIAILSLVLIAIPRAR